jgi:hypothetical protein
MTTSTAAQERAFAEVKRLCYVGLDAPMLHQRVLDCLGRVVPFAECTIQDHLSLIFDKAGVRGRRALVKLLYFDSLYPAPDATVEQ